MDHTMLPANNTISAFTHKHAPGGATSHIRIGNAWVQLTTHLSTQRGRMAELAMVGGRFLPQWGHLSTARHDAGQGKFAGHRMTFYPLCCLGQRLGLRSWGTRSRASTSRAHRIHNYVKCRDSVLSQHSHETHFGCLGLGLEGWCLGLGLWG